MKGKQMLAVMLLVCMAMGVTVFAVEEDSSELTNIILTVKNKITVPEDYTEFEYYYHQDEWKQGRYSLNWSRKEDYQSLSVGTDVAGNITQYHHYRDDSVYFSETVSLSEAEAIQLASEFLYRVNETARDRFFYESTENALGSFRINFIEKVNGILVKGSWAGVTIYKNNSQITAMNLSRSYPQDDFKDASGVIGLAEAKAAYIKNIDLPIEYKLYYNWQEKSITAFPAYVPKDYGVYAIDALTGEKIKAEESYFALKNSTEREEMAADSTGGMGGLSENERTEVENTSNLLSKEAVLEKVNTYFGSSNEFSIQSASLSRNTYNKEAYQWHISGRGVDDRYFSATVDAVNGMVLSFYCYSDKTEGDFDQAAAYEKIKNVLTQNAGSVFEEYQQRILEQDEQTESFTFLFDRYENGFKVNGNAIEATVSKAGVITSYNLRYDEKVTFPPVSTRLGAEAALNAFAKNAGFDLCYYPVHSYDEAQGKTIVTMLLIYDFTETPRALQPDTLQELDEKGGLYQANQAPAYQDLANHWVKNTVELLAYNNFYLITEDRFLPDQAVTQRDFISFLLKASHIEFENDEELYAYALRTQLVTEDEVNPDALIARKEAAKFLIRKLNMERLTKRPEIFVYPYIDSIDEAYKPYVSLCYALYLLNGDPENRFHPEQGLTRSECAVIILNLFKIEQL